VLTGLEEWCSCKVSTQGLVGGCICQSGFSHLKTWLGLEGLSPRLAGELSYICSVGCHSAFLTLSQLHRAAWKYSLTWCFASSKNLGPKHFAIRLFVASSELRCLKWQSTCFVNMKPRVQTPVPPKQNKAKKT
jgi:hypothetical protein